MERDVDSMLNEKILKIDFELPFMFPRLMYLLTHNVMFKMQQKWYRFISPLCLH